MAETHSEIAILGAGFSGLAMAIALRRSTVSLGLPADGSGVVVFEREPRIGGTWAVNRYPGCACDVPSHLYSLSYAPKPDWSRAYAPQPEILRYIDDVARQHGVGPELRLGSGVASARYDEASGRWRLCTDQGDEHTARVIISAVGGLSRPKLPEIPGLERFQGPVLHTARWDNAVVLSGQRVAVIGTGASAIQLVPQLARVAGHLDVFQRTPPWIVPRPDGPIAPWSQRTMARWPLLRRLRREALRWSMDIRSLAFVHLPWLMGVAEWEALRHLRRQVPDPALRRALTPSYRIGCKRILVADDYYPALCQPNVALRAGGASAIEADGVRDRDGVLHKADVLVLATGFEATRPLPEGVVFGPGGRDLARHFGDCPSAYLGTAVAGFPNLFVLVGPNTGLGHSSMLLMIEAQVGYVTQLLRWMHDDGLRTLAVRADAEARYNADLQERLRRTVWGSGCQSWYLSADGRNPTLWPGSTFGFERLLATLRRPDFVVETGRDG